VNAFADKLHRKSIVFACEQETKLQSDSAEQLVNIKNQIPIQADQVSAAIDFAFHHSYLP